MSPIPPIFVSHASADDAFVAQLRQALEGQGLPVWVDSRNLRGGAKLQPEIEAAIVAARQVIVVLSLQTVNSPWVRKEINHALRSEQQRKADGYRVIPLLLPGMTPAALAAWFDEEPLGLRVEIGPGGLSEALPAILAALGERLPTDRAAPAAPPPPPVAELILELRDPEIRTQKGERRARATATLVYQPADTTQRAIESPRYPFRAPLGPIELDEMRWYLEEYLLWPVGVFQQRAQRTEASLPQWGRQLLAAALAAAPDQAALRAWQTAADGVARRFSVWVDRDLPAGANKKRQMEAGEAASDLLALPWELLHDEVGHLFQGRNPVRVRRRLPNRKPQAVRLAQLPIRILLVSPRPEGGDQGYSVAYIDHRSSALPLVAAVENLGELATLTVLTPPTLGALEAELQRTAAAGQPYTVVHFDGHGVYDRQVGLGALLFEAPQDVDKLSERRMALVHADDLAALVRQHGIPLVFLEACQTAQVDLDPTASVAAALLAEGVASVVAMSHSVLVETSRRFVEAFYTALAAGQLVGAAMLAGQRALASDPYRGQAMGVGDFHLHDWFVPVLYQEQRDPQLFPAWLSQPAQQVTARQRRLRLGALPAAPPHHFIGRSHELLALERLLAHAPYAVLRGSGGEGKTTLAVELARWLVRSARFGRAAFVSLEQLTDARSVLDSLGHQLLPDGEHYSVAQYRSLAEALQPVTRALADQATMIVVDNVESILPVTSEQPTVVSDQSPATRPSPPAIEIFTLCQQLLEADPRTRLLFTSRERLPAPFDAGAHHLELGRLSERDATQLVEGVMAGAGWTPPATDAGETPQQIADLVAAVERHARALVLLAGEVAQRGVTATTANLHPLLADLERRHPGKRENSLYASVELSLRRLPADVRERVNALAVLHGGGIVWLMGQVMEVGDDAARAIADNLLEVGLAEEMDYSYLRLDPALPAYLRSQLPADAIDPLVARWAAAMQALVNFLLQQKFQDTQLQAQLTLLELPNLLALLDWLPAHVAAEEVVDVAGSIEQLLANLGRPGALDRAVQVREVAAKTLGGWSRAQFEAERLHIERLLAGGDLRAAYAAAEPLRQRALAAGEAAYADAAYDIARAHFLLGRVLRLGGRAGTALAPLAEAQRRFETLATSDASAAQMAAKVIIEQADCLTGLGQLEEATVAYEQAAERLEQQGDARSVAVTKGQLGTVRLYQERYADALVTYTDARAIFERLGEPASVAGAWHQIGRVHRQTGQFEAAERAYRQALGLRVQHRLRSDEAASLNELGNLYANMGRREEAVTFYRQAADLYVALGDQRYEGVTRSNIADTLVKLGRLDEARREIKRAIECKQPFGHAAQPWTTWNILHRIEQASGNAAAAQAAWQAARSAYLAYRRDGGYAQGDDGKLGDAIWQAVQGGDRAALQQANAELAEIINSPKSSTRWRSVATKFQAILTGARDPALADDLAIGYSNAAEVLLLIERLG